MDRSRLARLNTRLMKLRVQLLDRTPFFGILLTHLKPALSRSVSTAATDGEYLVVCPEFLEELDDEDARFLLLHEVMHCALGHCGGRRGGRDGEVWNVACDIVVNDILMDYLGRQPPLVLGSAQGFCRTPDGQPGRLFTAEQVYEMLLHRLRDGGDLGDLAGDGGAVQGVILPLDDHSGWERESARAARQDWQARTGDAARAAAAKGWGNLPGFAQRLVRKTPSRQLNWRAVLHSFLQTNREDYSYRRLHRGHLERGLIMPTLWSEEEGVEGLEIFLDVSASVTKEELAAMIGELASARASFGGYMEGTVHFFDAEVQGAQDLSDFLDKGEVTVPDGGGTSFQCVFDYLNQRCGAESTVIILTDGWAEYPSQDQAMGRSVLWLVTDEDCPPPWGEWAVLRV